MSYYINRNHFTDGQGYRMSYALINESILQNVRSTSCTKISEINALICFPQNAGVTITNLGGATTAWTTSNNVQIVSSSNSNATINTLNSNISGDAWIKATLSNGIIFEENFWVGKPNLDYDIAESFTMCRDINSTSNNFFPVSIKGSENSTTWEVQKITNNHYVSMQGNEVLASLQYAPPYNYIAFRVRASNSCGFSNWLEYYIEVIENCESGNNNSFIIYPNPVSDFVNIRAKNSKESININIPYQIYDFNGKLIKEDILRNQSAIDVSYFKKGHYILNIGNISEKHQIIIK